ncbi:hypothetical protein AU210_014347 [Fusarium oxysporum f. sp. radicis-cucumerinum]|uniref:Nephrocystin 3-like N-terminal domain-containing protein n=1 Tax=Fusarium oxysporum f. sp. radicis-cucumerinum TaxID=327505 RepID=A0A2H3GJQ0_FUSOX|nr:hypothetical protein AU210_014347 [Fusarium oxysporum f. sp. radicis-cucumerinum]
MSGDNAAFESEEYTVGWICALPLEMAAARGMLDLVHPNLSHQDPNDHNSYVLGEIHGHKIVIACLPVGNYGTSPAATVAINLLRTFKSIRFGLMVGIGGGAPSAQHDIRLGDVVIGQPSGTFGGVVQHDRGKVLPQGGFERTGFQNAPPQLLLAALARLQATHMNEDSQVPEYLTHLVAKSPKRMKPKFRYQGTSNDQLFQADYDHTKPGYTTCEDCDRSKLVGREEREDTDPYFHYGIIASGNQVIKDGKTRERLGKEYSALCFEMEAAGLYNFPCLVIRGICDYADSHKNNVWQEYAAAVAAAFSKELLLFVSPNQVLQEKKLLSELVSIAKDNLKTSKESLDEQRYIKKVLDNRRIDLHTVYNARYDSEDVQESPRCEPGTRVRLLEAIERWAERGSDQPVFWLVGPAGTGKSTIARSIVHTFDKDKRLVAGYFFKRGEQDRNDTSRLFSTLAMQFVDNVSSFKECLRQSLEGLDKDAVEKINLETQFHKLLWHPLENLQLNEKGPLQRIIVIDALDECERPEHLIRVLELLFRLCTVSKFRLRVLITSRSAPDIVEAFEPHLKNKTVRNLELHREFSEDTKIDIQNFLKLRFEDIRRKRRVQQKPWPTPDDLKLIVHLSTTPEPLFIYAATLCRFVSDKKSPRGPIRQLAIWLDQGNKSQLHQIYSPILDQAFRGCDESESFQKLRFLGAITLLAKPLSAKSLAIILGMDLDDISWWVPRLYAVLHVPSEFDKPIELLHKSFSDFLNSENDLGSDKYRINTTEIHADLAEKCIQCMKEGLKQDICNTEKPGILRDDIDKEIIGRHISESLEYACINWFYHVEHSGRPFSQFAYDFLFGNLLHWIEVLTLLGRLLECAGLVDRLLQTSQACENIDPDFAPLLQDAKRVISTFGSAIDRMPLQIYGSSIFFSPTASKIHQMFWRQRTPMSGQIQGVKADWSASLQAFEDPGGIVSSLAFSPDGRLLASIVVTSTFMDRKCVIQIRNVITGTHVFTSEPDATLVVAIAFSSDSCLLASAHRNRKIGIWNVATGRVEWILTGHKIIAIGFAVDANVITSVSQDGRIQYWEEVGATYQEKSGSPSSLPETFDREQTHLRATFSPSMQVLAYKTSSCRVEVWNIVTGERKKPVPGIEDLDPLSFSADSRLLALSYGENVTIRDVDTGATKLFLTHDDTVYVVAFSPSGDVIASGTHDAIRLWDLKTGACKTTLTEHSITGIRALAFSRDGLVLASPQQLWDTTQPQEHEIFGDHRHETNSIVLSPNGLLLASITNDKTIRIWDAETLVLRWVLVNTGYNYQPLFSFDSKLLATASGNDKLCVWSMSSGELQKTVEGEWGSISEVDYSADGQIVATVSSDPYVVKLWEAETGLHLHTLGNAGKSVKRNKARMETCGPSFSPDGRSIATYKSDNTLVLWDISTGKLLQVLSITNTARKVVFSHDSQLVAVVKSFCVFVWRINASEPLHILETEARAAAFSSDSRLLVLASRHRNVTVWVVATGSNTLTLEGHEGHTEAICISPNDQMIAVLSQDSVVRVWNLISHHKRHLTLCPNELISVIAFSMDGSVLATASIYNSIWLWNTASGTQLKKIICEEGLIRGISVLPDELVVSISNPPPFLNVWNDMELRIRRYRTTNTTEDCSPGRVMCDTGLSYDENSIRRGAENLLWVPPQYRPNERFYSRAWVSRSSTIYICSPSGHLIRFQSL